MARFQIKWFVNNENTYTAENLTFDQVWDEAVPGEALRADEGNRWHVMLKQPAIQKMLSMYQGDSFRICYQDPHVNPEYDTEVIVVSRIL